MTAYRAYVVACWRERLIPLSRLAWEQCRPMTPESLNAAWMHTKRAA